MERGIITMNEYGRVTIPTSTNVWMTEAEQSSLLGTIAPTLRAAIRADGYGMEVYALPMVVAIAFRINTPCAAMVRDTLLERLYGRKERQVLWVSIDRPMCEC